MQHIQMYELLGIMNELNALIFEFKTGIDYNNVNVLSATGLKNG